jgi:DNA-directed RNA polymerase specialized sigma24 family protein
MTRPSANNEDGAGFPGQAANFPTTRWTLVTRVREGGESRQAALEELCVLYWYPIYVFVRRRGYNQHDAEDITQGFFLKLLADESFEAADRDKGRLRTFLLSSLHRHLADQHRQQNAQKRGGGQQIIAFEDLHAEERYVNEPQDNRDPEWFFARAWAQLLIDAVHARMRETFTETGRARVFETLLPFLLWDDRPPAYREVAGKLEASETAVRLLVFRMRSSFRQLLRDEIGRTVLAPQDAADEFEWLKSVLVAK